MHFDVEEGDQHLKIVVPERRIDAAIATQFKDKLRPLVMKSKKPVHLDMRLVDFMDSSGLGAMIAVRKSLPEGMPLVLLSVTPNVERVFRLTRMDSVFDLRCAPVAEGGAA
jgi:anti-sigma B factor antagonist